MRCETFLRLYDELPPGAPPSSAMTRHSAGCPACRAARDRTDCAISGLRPESPSRARDEILDARLMAAIGLLPSPHKEFSTREWLGAGALIVASMLLIPFGAGFDIFKNFFGASYSLPLSIVLGFFLSAYGAFFIGSHLDEVRGFVERKAGLR